MNGRFMISFEKAQEKLHALALMQKKILEAKEVPLEQAYAHISYRDIYAHEYHPSFDNSSMDGFAVRASDLAQASLNAPQSLTVIGESSAGSPFDASLGPGQTCRIMTGAKIPKGADAVIKVEDVTELGGQISVSQAIIPGLNIRQKGEDLRPGDLLVPKGTPLSPEDILLLSSQGKNKVTINKPIRISIISTGQEIRSAGTSPDPLMGEIRNSTGPFLKAKLKQLPCELISQESSSDKVDDLFNSISRAINLGSDIIISTGGVSAGRYDMIPGMISDLQGRIDFHKVSMKPGKPILVASFSKTKPCTYFGLPGNPISTMIGCNFFVEPFLKHLTGQTTPSPVKAILKQEISTSKNLTTFLRANVGVNLEAKLEASLCQGQGSHMLSSLRGYNAWLKIDKGIDHLPKGTLVDAFLLSEDSRFIY